MPLLRHAARWGVSVGCVLAFVLLFVAWLYVREVEAAAGRRRGNFVVISLLVKIATLCLLHLGVISYRDIAALACGGAFRLGH